MTFSKAFSKRDKNQSDIVRTLRQVPNVSVKEVHQIGGFCDIVVGFRRCSYMFEIKQQDTTKKEDTEDRRLSKLTDDELIFISTWTGHYKVVYTADEILKEIGVLK